MDILFFGLSDLQVADTSVSLSPVLRLGQLLAPWTVLALLAWTGWLILRDTITYSIGLHKIPCSRCKFFTGNYRLKCTIHPKSAMSEAAINCPDFYRRTEVI
jgi:hypothetical protein